LLEIFIQCKIDHGMVFGKYASNNIEG